MKMFEYYEPETMIEACSLLADSNAKAIAGGTDLLVQIRHGVKKPSAIVNLKYIDELNKLNFSNSGVRIGSLTKISEAASCEKIIENWPAFSSGADKVGTPQVRNLATVGGNICNSSPCADTVPGLIVSDAIAVITNGKKSREIPLADFFTAPGKNCMKTGELLSEIFVPFLPKDTRQAFAKLGPRKAADIAIINMAISLSFNGDKCEMARIALGSVAPTPLRAREAEKMLIGSDSASRDIDKIAYLIASAARPIDDVRGSANYRKSMLEATAKELLTDLCK